MFFIRDCNGTIVGNSKGYRTYKGAMRQAEYRYSKAYAQIWSAFYSDDGTGTMQENGLIYSIQSDN